MHTVVKSENNPGAFRDCDLKTFTDKQDNAFPQCPKNKAHYRTPDGCDGNHGVACATLMCGKSWPLLSHTVYLGVAPAAYSYGAHMATKRWREMINKMANEKDVNTEGINYKHVQRRNWQEKNENEK